VLTRKCFGRVVTENGSYGCPKEGVKIGKDGRFRCLEHDRDTYPVKVVPKRKSA
jgi:hypothetical protein